MNLFRDLNRSFVGGLALAAFGCFAVAPLALTQQAASEASGGQTANPAAPNEPHRAEAYYNFTVGHVAEQMFESTSREEYATQALEFYKKAYALDPASPVIGERLAEMYWKAQRVRDAVQEAQQILKREPNDLPTRRLLARIYLRSLGDISSTSVPVGGAQTDGATPNLPSNQAEAIRRAAEQYREILRIDPTDTESALWLARLYRLQNAHEKAEEVLRGVLKQDPESESAIEQLTQLLLDQGKSADAVALLEGIAQRSPSPALLELLGDAYTQTKDLPKAESAYRKAIELDPSELSHQRGLGQTLVAEEKYPEALATYQKLVELEPEDADIHLRLAQIYRELHKLDKAEESLLKARQRAPGSLEVIYNEAMLYEAQGRFEDAIRVLSDTAAGIKNQASAVPSSRRTLAILYQQLGQLYREIQNYQAAIFSFQEMQRLGDEEDRRARLLIIDTYRAAKNLPRALEESKKALEKYPNDLALRASRAMLLGENGQVDEAVQLLRGQLSSTEADRDTYLNIAQVYERSRRYKEAEESARLAEALPGQPHDNEMVWFLLGAIYERQKQFDRAETEFKKVLAVNPRNAPVLNYYGYMLGDLGIRLDEAGSLVLRALAEEPHNGAYLDSQGWIYFKQNKFADAEASLRKALERESRDPTIHSHLGDVYFRSGKKELAAVEWEKSLAEWHKALPSELENDKVAELEKKLTQVKHRIAQQKPAGEDAKPQ